jgi:hypothetical protein
MLKEHFIPKQGQGHFIPNHHLHVIPYSQY